MSSRNVFRRSGEIMISYSRRDAPFIELLCSALDQKEVDYWVDKQDIQPTAKWWGEIQRGIRRANAVVFIISPDSLMSPVCQAELGYALKLNKRILPVLYRDVFKDSASTDPRPTVERLRDLDSKTPDDSEDIHPDTNWRAIQALNFIYIQHPDDLAVGVEKIIKAVRTEPEHVNSHTRLVERAHEWEDRNQNRSYLLKEAELKAAEAWLREADRNVHLPAGEQPTTVQRAFIHASRVNQRRSRVRRVQIAIGAVVTLTVIIVVAAILLNQSEINTSRALTLAKESERDAVTQELQRKQTILQQSAVNAFSRGDYGEVLSTIQNADVEGYSAVGADWLLYQLVQNRTRLQKSIPFDITAVPYQFEPLWSPDGKRILSVPRGLGLLVDQKGLMLVVWDTETGKPLDTFTQAPANFVYTPSWTADGKSILVSDKEAKIKLLDAQSGAEQLTLSAPDMAVSALAWSPLGYIAAISYKLENDYFDSSLDQYTLTIWDAKTGAQIAQRPIKWYLTGLAYSPDGQTLAVSTHQYDENDLISSREVWFLDGQTGATQKQVPLIDDQNAPIEINSLSILRWSPDNLSVYIQDDHNYHTGYKISISGDIVSIVDMPFKWQPGAEDGQPILKAGNSTVGLIDDQGNTLLELPVQGSPTWVDPSTIAIVVLATQSIDYYYVGDLPDVRVEQSTVSIPTSLSLKLSPSKQYFAPVKTSLTEPRLNVWDVQTGKSVFAYESQDQWVDFVGWSPDGKRLITGGSEGKIILWDTGTWQQINILQSTSPTASFLSEVLWNADYSRFATETGGSYRVWDSANGNPVGNGTVAANSPSKAVATAQLPPPPSGDIVQEYLLPAGDMLLKKNWTSTVSVRITYLDLLDGFTVTYDQVPPGRSPSDDLKWYKSGAISPDGRYWINPYDEAGNSIITPTANVIETATGKVAREVNFRSSIFTPLWLTDTLLLITTDTQMALCDLAETGSCPIGEIPYPVNYDYLAVEDLKFSPDGQYMLWSRDRAVYQWAITSMSGSPALLFNLEQFVDPSMLDQPVDLRWSADGTQLIIMQSVPNESTQVFQYITFPWWPIETTHKALMDSVETCCASNLD